MSPAGELSWLCRLIDESLRPYTEPEVVVSICKEKEKEILVALSRVLRKIQLRIRRCDSNTHDTVVKPDPSKECLCESNPLSNLHQCLPKILADMVILLSVKSPFVQHLAVNVLVLTSKFVSATGNNWNQFIYFLCLFLEKSIARTLSYSCSPSGFENSNHGSSGIDFLIQYGLKYCDWSTIAGINQVLRVIFKHLKDDCDEQLVKVCYDCLNCCLSKVPWDLLGESQVCDIGGAKESTSVNLLPVNDFSAVTPGVKFFGTFLQLLCSLVDQNDIMDTEGGPVDKHPILITVVNLIPSLVKWCLNKQGDYAETCIIQYFKHKLLILMIRLFSHTCLDCLVLLSWLDLLHNYFQDLLWQPLTQFQSDQEDCLHGSPFLLSLSDGEVSNMHSSHLQRQAIFIFLNCSFSLICQRGDTAVHCVCSTSYTCLTNNLDSELEQCCRKRGSRELFKWLQRHLPTEISINPEKHLQIRVNFMSSFLQLYLQEDDLLFEVLLQLLSVTSQSQHQFDKKQAAPKDAKEDFSFHLSDIFNPVHLFHIFLSEIHYDHQVLLDYLISKDTGISCLKYLLRCLRLVCNSWQLFIAFPSFEESLNQVSCKKRKVLRDGSEFLADVVPSLLDNKGSIPSHGKNHKEDHEYGFKYHITQSFKEATKCLLSLKNSVENLHQKNLFPYNPEVLLKHLRRFQEFSCEKEGWTKND